MENIFNMNNGKKQMNSHFELALINRLSNKMMSSDQNQILLNPFCVMRDAASIDFFKLLSSAGVTSLSMPSTKTCIMH